MNIHFKTRISAFHETLVVWLSLLKTHQLIRGSPYVMKLLKMTHSLSKCVGITTIYEVFCGLFSKLKTHQLICFFCGYRSPFLIKLLKMTLWIKQYTKLLSVCFSMFKTLQLSKFFFHSANSEFWETGAPGKSVSLLRKKKMKKSFFRQS